MQEDVKDTRLVFGSARWIWWAYRSTNLANCFLQARRGFRLEKLPRRAVVKVTADSRYKLYVNGHFVCRGPARGFQSHWPYDEVDIAPFLRRGQNAIAMLVHNYGRGTYQYISEGGAGAILQGRAGRVDISTGKEWLVRLAPGYGRSATAVSAQLGYQETFDARLDDGSWTLPSYRDARREADSEAKPRGPADKPGYDKWHRPSALPAGTMPWHMVEPRGIPLQSSELITPVEIIAQCEGRSGAGWRTADNLTAAYLRDKRKWVESPAKSKRSRSGLAVAVPKTARGKFRSYIIDFGREVVGSIIIEARGARGGETVDTQVFETMTDGKPDVTSPYIDCIMAFANRLVLAKGKTLHEQFEPWGFRYLAVTVRENAKPLDIKVRLRSALYPLDVKASFKSSDRRLNGIYDISVRAQECCMMDAYIDCPWREQAQWWGDARVQAANTFHLSADERLARRGIRSIAAQEVPNGLTYGMTPTIGHECILPDYTLTWIMTLWDYYWQTGDKSLLSEQADRMERALAYFDAVEDKNGLIPYDERYWLFLDWADIFKEGYPTVYNIMYFWALRTAADIFGLAGRTPMSKRCASKAETVRVGIMKRLFDAKRREFYGGLDWKGRPVKKVTPHAPAMAIVSGLCPEHDGHFARKVLIPLTKGPFPDKGSPDWKAHGSAQAPSPFFMYYVFEALKSQGFKAEVIDCIGRWWGAFVDWGLSTTPEDWMLPGGHLSACHAWSAHPIVHFHNILLGVTQASAGWNKVNFAPVFAGDSAEGAVATPHGMIESRWKRVGKTVTVKLVVPRGVTARVALPGVKATAGRGAHSWKVEA